MFYQADEEEYDHGPADYALHVLIADSIDAVEPYLNASLQKEFATWCEGSDLRYYYEVPNTMSELLKMKCCLCITTMGRDEQLTKALPIAIWLAWCYAEVTLYLVDFNHHDDLERWVLANLHLPIKIGKLKYYRCRTLPSWHASLAKNTAHMAAVADLDDGLTSSGGKEEAVLVNLDGDNLFSPTWLRNLLEDEGPKLGMDLYSVIHYQNQEDPGTYGRLAYLSTTFAQVRGYDTSFLPVGCQDTDLVNRLAIKDDVFSVKARYVGVSIPNAPPTGDTKTDREASKKAPPHAIVCMLLSRVGVEPFRR